MVEKVKIFYFSVFIVVIIAFIFHINAMGHHHWKRVTTKNSTVISNTTIGLFTRCIPSTLEKTETCFPNMYPRNASCYSWSVCLPRSGDGNCQCDFLPSTKGIASCAIIAAVFLGLAIILLFIHSIKTTESRAIELFLGLCPLIFLLLAFIFILIALILVGSYLSRDVMHIVRSDSVFDLGTLRQRASESADIRVDWSTGLEIIALFFSFLSFVLYSLYVFKLGRAS